jgi:hypothetical protein
MPIIDAVHDRGQLFVPMSLNGSAPHYFILDTGAGVSAVDAALAAQLRLPAVAETELAGTAGVMTVPQVRVARIAPLYRGRVVDELACQDLTPTTQDLSAFQVPVSGATEAGLLGNDYLRRFVVAVRLDQPALEIARPDASAPAGLDPGRYIPFWMDDNSIVRVRGRLDDWMNVDLRFDTGSATMTVDGPYLNVTVAMWQALRRRHPEYQVHDTLEANAIGGSLKLDVGTIGSLDVGPLRFDRVKVVIQPPVGYFASAGAVGFIALNLFQANGRLTFDYPNGRLWL